MFKMQVIVRYLILLLLVPSLSRADLTNDAVYIAEECLTCHHLDAIKGSLLVFAKQNHLTDDEMAARLLYIADSANGFTDSYGRAMSPAAIGGLCFFRNAESALPALETYITKPITRSEALSAYGHITQYDNRFFKYVNNALNTGNVGKDLVRRHLYSALTDLDTENWQTSRQSRLRMTCLIMKCQADTYDSSVFFDRFMANIIPDYTNSIEHVRVLEQNSKSLYGNRDQIVKSSCYRGEWGGSAISDDEWYCRVTNDCHSEIARVMALPENERLNLTAILDAQIADMEKEEARTARRAVWRRRLRLGAFFLPIPVVAFAILFWRRRSRCI